MTMRRRDGKTEAMLNDVWQAIVEGRVKCIIVLADTEVYARSLRERLLLMMEKRQPRIGVVVMTKTGVLDFANKVVVIFRSFAKFERQDIRGQGSVLIFRDHYDRRMVPGDMVMMASPSRPMKGCVMGHDVDRDDCWDADDCEEEDATI